MLDEIPCLTGYMPGGIPCGVGYRVGYIRWYAGLDGKKDEHGDAPVANNGTRWVLTGYSVGVPSTGPEGNRTLAP